MRILHVLDHSVPLHSGYSFRTLAILREQRARGWETAHVTSAKHPADAPEEDVDGFKFYRTADSARVTAAISALAPLGVIHGLFKRLTDLIPALKPDILHAHSPSLNGVAALRAGRRFGIPVVYEIRALWEDGAVDHGTMQQDSWRYRASRALESYVLRRADAVTTICDGLRSEVLARGVSSSRVTIVPNGVDTTRFAGERLERPHLALELGLQGATPVIGYVGSFFGYEGLPLLLEALPRILARWPNGRVLLVGGGPDEPHLRRQAEASGLADKVVFAGRAPHAEIAAYYDLVDVFVYPRFRNRLTELVTPLKPLEAMARGRLVVASDVGGHRELIRHGATGILFPAGDAAALARSICDVLDDPDRCRALRTAARRFVKAERGWPESVDRYRAVYGGLVGRADGTARSAETVGAP